MRNASAIACALLIQLTGCGTGTGEEAWVEEALGTLDSRGRAAQLVVQAVSPAVGDTDALLRRPTAVGRPIAGVWIEGGDPVAIASLTAALRARPGLPPLIGADSDGGLGARIPGSTAFPPLRHALRVGSVGELERVGATIAREAAALGIGFGFVRGPRTTGGAEFAGVDATALPRKLAALLDGARDEGTPLAIGLFWSSGPGRPVTWDRARLEAIELPLLAAAGDAAALVPGMIDLPAFSGEQVTLPFSPVAYRKFREESGWSAPIIADLRADSEATPLEAVRAIAAGADLVIVRGDPTPIVGAITSAVLAGSIPRGRIEAATRRVLALKYRTARSGLTSPSPDSVRLKLRNESSEALASTLTARLAGGEPFDSASPESPALPRGLRIVDGSEVGMSETALVEVDEAIEEAIRDSTFTAAALAIGRRGGLVRFRGYAAADAPIGSVDPETTIFDLASLTKVVGTTTAAAILMDAGELALDDPIQRYVEEFDGESKDEVTVRHLLTHTSGLPPGLWLYGSATSREEALRQVFAQPLRRAPGEQVEYSDLGMILLAEVVERSSGMPIDRLLAMKLFTPLDMSSTMFLPPLALRTLTVPSAIQTERPFILRGVVHDGNAFRLGGVTGHAGLFSTARDLAIFSQMMLDGGRFGETRVLSEELVRELTRRQEGAEERALGWDTPADRSSAGRFFSSRSYGHTGYTGTSIWIDPARELFVVLLTNRTYTEASSGDVLDVRIDVHEAAARAIVDDEITRRPGAR